MTTFVGLDLGTLAGLVRVEVDFLPITCDGEFRIIYAGHYDLRDAVSKAGKPARWAGYRNYLCEYAGDADFIFFEDVPEAAHTGALAARVHGGLRATLELFLWDEHIRNEGVSIQAIKRAMTGTSGARKSMMKTAAWNRFRLKDPTPSGDVADALGAVLAGTRKLGYSKR